MQIGRVEAREDTEFLVYSPGSLLLVMQIERAEAREDTGLFVYRPCSLDAAGAKRTG